MMVWLVWRTHLDGGRVRITVAEVHSSLALPASRASQPRYQDDVEWLRSWEMHRRTLRDGTAYKAIVEAVEESGRLVLPPLRDALRERGILPGGER